MNFTEDDLEILPNTYLMKHFGFDNLTNLRYQQGTICIKRTGNGNYIKEIRINGVYARRETALIKALHQGYANIQIITDE